MRFKNSELDLFSPQVMGIVNVTPDSFSDGGKHNTCDAACRLAETMSNAGATLIDIGGESTRPGAGEVSEQEELDRVIPVIEKLANILDVVISVDTSKAKVMSEAVAAGAALINDVRALQETGALQAAARAKVPVCLMHMQGQPRTMQSAPDYRNVTDSVIEFLLARIDACKAAGIDDDAIIVDPGFGFGKSLDHNYQLMADIKQIIHLGYPVLVGVSRKSMIGDLLHRPVEERLAGSLALATYSAQSGAHILRVHDVAETVDAVSIINKLQEFRKA